MRKKMCLKYTSLLLCTALAAGCITGCKTTEDEAASTTESVLENALTSTAGAARTNVLSPNSRLETVYVFSNADGTTDHITVHEKEVDSDGNETLTKSESDGEIPVDIRVSYTLDGVETKPEALIGKSGNLTIRFDYTNHLKKEVSVDGTKQEVTVPFTMITGLALPTETFSNIRVTNGKLTQIGDNVVAVGMTMPGLSDTLSLRFNDKDLDFEIPEFFEVTADVENFSLSMTMSVATSNLLTDIDVNDLSIEDLKESAAALQDSTSQLEAGAKELTSGTATLLNGSRELSQGSKSLLDGSNELVNGSASLADGAGKLADGTVQLKSSLENGAEKAKESYQTAYDSFYRIAFAVSCIQNGIDPNAPAPQQQAVIAASLAQAGLSQAADITSSTQYAAATGFIIKNYSGVQQVVAAKLMEANPSIDAASLAAGADQQIVTITSGLSQAVQAYSSCSTTLSSLDSSGFFSGMSALDEGVQFLQAGTVKLQTGAKTLYEGAVKLEDGVSTLYAGTLTLQDGMVRFNTEGINRLSRLVNEDARDALVKLKAVVLAGQEYSSYLGHYDEKEGSVIFIYRTEELAKES